MPSRSGRSQAGLSGARRRSRRRSRCPPGPARARRRARTCGATSRNGSTTRQSTWKNASRRCRLRMGPEPLRFATEAACSSASAAWREKRGGSSVAGQPPSSSSSSGVGTSNPLLSSVLASVTPSMSARANAFRVGPSGFSKRPASRCSRWMSRRPRATRKRFATSSARRDEALSASRTDASTVPSPGRSDGSATAATGPCGSVATASCSSSSSMGPRRRNDGATRRTLWTGFLPPIPPRHRRLSRAGVAVDRDPLHGDTRWRCVGADADPPVYRAGASSCRCTS